MIESTKKEAGFGVCGFCGFTYYGRPNLCRQCGTLLHEAAEEAQRSVDDRFKRIWWQKARAYALFISGIVIGGPLMAVGSTFRVGVGVALAGTFSSLFRRYSNFSTPTTVVAGCVPAFVLITAFVEPPRSAEQALEAEAARVSYVQTLAEQDADVFVETRGQGNLAVWFDLPTEVEGECGSYPPEEIRGELAELGFLRVVVATKNQGGGLCSFRP